MPNAEVVRAWIYRHSPKARPSGREVCFPCPHCGHSAHYFNPAKGVGFCHRAACQRYSTISHLEVKWGPPASNFFPVEYNPGELEPRIELPSGCIPLVSLVEGQYVTLYPEAVEALQKRGVKVEDAYLHSIQLDVEDDRVVIPVLEDGDLVNFVSRAVWWYEGKTDYKRYMYAKGADTGKYLFNFAMVNSPHLAIVENTFNAIWLRHHFPCTSSFGSHLSVDQVAKLCGAKSKVRSVTLMWDSGAEARAQEACVKLRRNGVSAEFVKFPKDRGQPDGHSAEALLRTYVAAALVYDSGGGHPKGIEVADV